MRKIVLVSGGLYSSIGKGVFTSSLAASDPSERKRYFKIDPYLNHNTGSLNPNQHGEIFVSDDGKEVDLDSGIWEKYTGCKVSKNDSLTGGAFHCWVAEQGRKARSRTLTYSMVISSLVDRLRKTFEDADVLYIELGGSVTDEENFWCKKIFRRLKREWGRQFVHYHLAPVFYLEGTIKTKPLQVSYQYLAAEALAPDFLVCCNVRGDQWRKTRSYLCDKLFDSLGIDADRIIVWPWLEDLLFAPRLVAEQVGGSARLANLRPLFREPLVVEKRRVFSLVMVHKYRPSPEVFWNLEQSLRYSFRLVGADVRVDHFCVRQFTRRDLAMIRSADGVIFPGGFGRKHFFLWMLILRVALSMSKPILGVCFGKQLALAYFCSRRIGTLACSTEVTTEALPLYVEEEFCLGGRDIALRDGTSERVRFRNRWCFNPGLEGLIPDHFEVRARDTDGRPVFLESGRDRLVLTQFHPEFTSYPWKVHASLGLFRKFICGDHCELLTDEVSR